MLFRSNEAQLRGMGKRQAIEYAANIRLRPILMTTASMVAAMLPSALRLGEGSELRAPMAVVVIGGLLTSTLLTLVFIPAVYTIVDDVQNLFGRLLGHTGIQSQERLPDIETEPVLNSAP